MSEPLAPRAGRPTRRRRVVSSLSIAFSAATFAIALAGCAAMGPPAQSIEVVHDHQPDDIPIPIRFVYDDREEASFAYIKFQDAPRLAMRSMRLTYWGDRPIQEVENWYLDQMPKHGWRHLRTDSLTETHMTFGKGPERAEILLKRTPDEHGRYYVTRLVVEIGVKGEAGEPSGS